MVSYCFYKNLQPRYAVYCLLYLKFQAAPCHPHIHVFVYSQGNGFLFENIFKIGINTLHSLRTLHWYKYFPFDQNFRLAFPKFPCTEWNGIFHQARSILARDKLKMANLRTFLFLSEFFDDFEFTDDILEDDDDVVMFKKARFFFLHNHIEIASFNMFTMAGIQTRRCKVLKAYCSSRSGQFSTYRWEHLEVQCCHCRQHRDASKRTQNHRW